MGMDISTMTEEQLRALRNELQERRASPIARRSVVKREAKVLNAVKDKSLVDLNTLIDL